jgi:hypothetical protein
VDKLEIPFHHWLPLIDSAARGLGMISRLPIDDPGVWLGSGVGWAFRIRLNLWFGLSTDSGKHLATRQDLWGVGGQGNFRVADYSEFERRRISLRRRQRGCLCRVPVMRKVFKGYFAYDIRPSGPLKPHDLLHGKPLPLHGKTSFSTLGYCRKLTFKVDQKMGSRSLWRDLSRIL